MERISHFMQEFIYAEEKDKLPAPEIDKRVSAIREMFRADSAAQLRETMTVAQFPLYFGTALSRMFLKDYTSAVGSWKNYTFADTTPDFRNVDRYRMSRPGTLHLRREKAEAKATEIAETRIQYHVEEYSDQMDFSWQTLQNDDLGIIRESPTRMAQSAALFDDQFVSNLYDNAVTQATLAALGAPWAGTGRLTVPNLAIGLNAMKQRVDAQGNIIPIKKVYLVIPSILEIQAAQITKDLIQYGGPTSNVLSTFLAGQFTDPYIATAGANVPWYLFADPNEIPSVTVARLQGFAEPFVYQKTSDITQIFGNAPAAFAMGSFATGDIEYGVSDIIGGWNNAGLVGVTDFRGLYFSSGTTA